MCMTSAVYQHGEAANAMHMKTLRESGIKALEELRRTGVVTAIGLGVNETAVVDRGDGFR